MDQQQTSIGSKDDHLPWLDGLRGGAALWVLLSHIQILTGMKYVPVLSWGGLAVDLFMILSGFLMAHHYIQRQKTEPWDQSRTFFAFWLRRFFRIAPLYYVLLIVSLLLGPMLGEYRSAIAAVWPDTATAAERYMDHGVVNTIAHLTFVFGFLPDFAFRTPLPDWSIGLEMQFYLVFPFIMLTIARIGPIKASFLFIATCIALKALFPAFFHQFEMPSFLPMKLYVFFAGIWIAVARSQASMRPGFVVALCLVAAWMVLERSQIAMARVLLVVAMFYLMNNGTLPASRFLQGATDRIRACLSGPVSQFMGETSYAAYLLHLMIVLPIAGGLATFPQYQLLHPAYRFGICFLLAAPFIYSLSWLLFNYVEKNGIQMGKIMVRATRNKAPAPDTVGTLKKLEE